MMDLKITELEKKINELDSVKILSKRLSKSSDIKNDINKLEKELNDLSIRLDDLQNYKSNDNNMSDESSESNESSESSESGESGESGESSESNELKIDIKKITARISETKNKIDGEIDIAKRVELYYQMKADIEQCKRYYNNVKMIVKNLN